LTNVFFGIYYTDYQAFASGLFSGKLTPGAPFRSLYFITNYGISYTYSYLYEWFPNIEWLSWIYSCFIFISFFIGLYLLAVALPKKTSPIKKIISLFVVFFVVFADNEIHFICSHISYMTCGLSLLGIVCYIKSTSAIRSKPLMFIFFNVLFTLGTLTRVESGTACFLLIGAFSLLYLQDFKLSIILLLYPFLLVASLSIAISLDVKNSTEFYKQIEPDIEAQFQNRGNKVPLSMMKTLRDTVLYTTASDIVWSDPKVITPQFLRSLILPEKFMFTDNKQWYRVYINVSAMVAKYWYLVIINFLLAAALLFQYDFGKLNLRWFYWLIFEISFWALITVQTYVYKLNDRSFTPYLSLFILCHILLLAATDLSVRRSASVNLLASVISIFFIVQFYHLIIESNNLKQDLSNYQSNYEKLKKVASGHYLVLNSSSCDYICLSNVPFKPFDFSSFKKIYITEGSIIPFIPYYRKYLEKECKCDMYAYPSFYDYLKSIHDDVVIVSTPYRMEVIRNYLWEIHQYKLPIEEIDTSFDKVQKNENRDNFDELKMYRLGR
jgi:hypothetical protein